jgi:D,D-heptose 1,7-bisphosphate phosphatase
MNKEDKRLYYKNCVNAGVEIISPEILKETMKDFVPCHADQPDKIDLDRDVLKKNVTSGKIFAYDTPEYIKDMGTPDRFYAVEDDMRTGKVTACNLKNPQKAVFLDRDGVINKEVQFLKNPDQMELIQGAAEAIKLINESGYLAIVVTNQPVIARGDVVWEELGEINNKMETLLGAEHAYLNDIYICPHHPDKGFQGERPEYKIDCECRKPKPGLLLKAAKDWNIDLANSLMIGDSDRDCQAGINAGVMKSIKIMTNTDNALLEAIKEYL